MSWSNIRDNVRACSNIVSERSANERILSAVPFQTERANKAPEGLIASQSFDIHLSQAVRRSL
jgi:hypothetical protein